MLYLNRLRPYCKYKTRLERLSSSLFRTLVNYGHKKFYKIWSWWSWVCSITAKLCATSWCPFWLFPLLSTINGLPKEVRKALFSIFQYIHIYVFLYKTMKWYNMRCPLIPGTMGIYIYIKCLVIDKSGNTHTHTHTHTLSLYLSLKPTRIYCVCMGGCGCGCGWVWVCKL